ncbi:putative uncharacterized protein DDB_G0282133 isoform X2 [Uranotaenia lowii]|uniref:putative uncharacterized protein DDB_G0282133 isoform X2 n=1 Tax=Uranotaenia lowii TaxID=190385 RepID=UPI002478908B|nr:putative uncharacterized protein DDB_G0282133 isoform X2 [Uranotaenia lowii]
MLQPSWHSPDIARALAGPDILQKHSINSLLEHNESIISRGLPSPIDENMSFSDILGTSQSSTSTSSSLTIGSSSSSSSSGFNSGGNSCSSGGKLQQNLALVPFGSLSSLGGGDLSPDSGTSSSILSLSGGSNTTSSPVGGGSTSDGGCRNPFTFSSPSMTNFRINSMDMVPYVGDFNGNARHGAGGGGGGGGGSGNAGGGGGGCHSSPPSYGNAHSTMRNFDDFRFDSDIGLSSSNGGSAIGVHNLSSASDALRMVQRNNNLANSNNSDFEASLASNNNNISDDSKSGLSARYLRGSQQLNELNRNTSSYDCLSVGGGGGGGNGGGSSSFYGGGGLQSSTLSRSNSLTDLSLLPNLDSTNLLDIMNCLNISQQQTQQGSPPSHHSRQSSLGGQLVNSGSGSGNMNNSNSQLFSNQNSNLLTQLYQQQLQQLTSSQQQQQGGSTSLGGSCSSAYGAGNENGQQSSGGNLTISEYDTRNMLALNLLRQQLEQIQQIHQTNQFLPNYGNAQLKTWQLPNSGSASLNNDNGGTGNSVFGGNSGSLALPNEPNLDRIARNHRASAAFFDPTCMWYGYLPFPNQSQVIYSQKIFLGGMPWDISEQSLVQIFKPFGSIKVEWPGKEQQTIQPKGYVYIIFESEKQVRALLQACTYSYPEVNLYEHKDKCGDKGFRRKSNPPALPLPVVNENHQQHMNMAMQSKCPITTPMVPPGARVNFKITTKRSKVPKDVEVIPWNTNDANFVKESSHKLDPSRTVFVGALHGQMTADALAHIMEDLFQGVIYVGIDTDKYKYPLGSARVTFNNERSYMKAVMAAYIHIKTVKFNKKLQVDPYLEDSLCSVCGVQHGPYFCRELACFRYFCRSCWQIVHNSEASLQNHKPLTRNSKSTSIVGIGPQQHQQGPSDSSSGMHQQQQPPPQQYQYYQSHQKNQRSGHHNRSSPGNVSCSSSSSSSTSSSCSNNENVWSSDSLQNSPSTLYCLPDVLTLD